MAKRYIKCPERATIIKHSLAMVQMKLLFAIVSKTVTSYVHLAPYKKSLDYFSV